MMMMPMMMIATVTKLVRNQQRPKLGRHYPKTGAFSIRAFNCSARYSEKCRLCIRFPEMLSRGGRVAPM